MEYSNKQIKQILRIQEFIGLSNTLAEIYIEYDDKELSLKNLSNKEKIYKAYCSSISNSIDAIKNSEYLFSECKKFHEFIEYINKEYVASEKEYFDNPNYKSNFYKIIKTIRNQVNHINRDDEDDNMLFQIYIDFDIIENVRLIINDIFNEIYFKIDKNKIESIILSNARIKYIFDDFNNKITVLEDKIVESDNKLNEIFKSENEEALQLLKDFIEPNNLIKAINGDEIAIDKCDSIDKRTSELFEKAYQYVCKNGNEESKKAMEAIKQLNKVDVCSKNDYDNKLNKLLDDIKYHNSDE